MAKKLLDTPESENKKELKSESKNIEKSKQDKKKEKKISNKKMLNKSPNGFSMWRIYWFLFVICITWGLRSLDSATPTNLAANTWTMVSIDETEEITLNQWLGYYRSGDFKNVVVINDQELEWYKFLSSGETETYFQGKISTEKYKRFKTEKSDTLSILDLWIALTWDTEVSLVHKDQSIWEKLAEQMWWIVLLLLALAIWVRFILPKAWANWMFGMKVWKENKKNESKTKFSDIAWMDEVKNELIEIIDYLKEPEKYQKIWARPPKWVLLYWAPWSWKTLLARAVAGEAWVAFFSASWSEFMEMLVWMWAARVRKLFEQAKIAGKAIIFIDEIDAIWKKRGVWYTWGHQEQEQTLNQILTEMDWFDKNTNIIVMAATNRPDTLDPALLRAWRFDRKVFVSVPTFEERIQIFEYYLKKKKVNKEVNIQSLAKRTSWLVWADIENIVNEAALQVAKTNREELENHDFEYALEKVIMWPEKKVKSMKENEKKIVAYHELWHAVTWHLLDNTDPIEKISIVRRWHALGVTWTTPEEDKNLYSKAKFLDEIVSLLWGRAAEEVFFGKEEITTWASNDLERATEIVKSMILKYGMDDDFGPINYLKEWEEQWWTNPYSENIAQEVDKKIKDYLQSSYKKAKAILKANEELINKMANILLEKEYLSSEEFLEMMKEGKKI